MYFVGISVADIRKEPKFESERDSQLIYGEEVRVISTHSDYSLIEGRDGLQGYMKSRLIVDGEPRAYKLKAGYNAETARFPFGSYVSKEDVNKYGFPGNNNLKNLTISGRMEHYLPLLRVLPDCS